ncbi:MAG TPA: STAS domain-containing protein [Amycolatopsis sp.]|uniref:STAS domain-containing protein n=1 Tax=Amycolatopsis sp. TaxID=37632 RepID=UPI002B486A8B|nr:STAS domain-containing protein [Amycolatopsis sp.]HKS44064.1 STAS domain-containing protein [Amycolatopsis sp.]
MTRHEGIREPGASVVRTVVDGDTARVLLFGEIDHGAVAQLDQALHELLDAGAVRLVMDFENLSFFDSACISALVRARAQAEDRGGTMMLANLDRYARRILDLTGLLSSFTVEEDVATEGAG